MNKPIVSTLALALALCITPQASAEDSEYEPTAEEIAIDDQYADLPESVKTYLAYLEDIDHRYPDSGEIDVETFMALEGEQLASRYCGALGFDGACAPAETGDEPGAFRAVDPAAYARTPNGTASGKWWNWLWEHLFNIGVIPEKSECPAPMKLVEIRMDDEDRKNDNQRGGWIGATLSNQKETTYRFCKLDTITSLQFRPLPVANARMHDYSVANLAIFCPSGGRRYLRVEEGELSNNSGGSTGDVFPNFRIYNTWFNFYCHFEGGRKAFLGQMKTFPEIGTRYGVFAPSNMPATYALQRGWVHQDDEDTLNWNSWWFFNNAPVTEMSGGRNTDRSLVKVK